MNALLSEIVVDSFAGGGGASEGIEMALRGMSAQGALLAPPDVTIAINHSGAALAMHTANHPNTTHLEADIWTIDPLSVTAGRPVGLLWASPDCRHFSKAKGGAPVSDSVRGLAHVVGHWAEQVRPRLIFLENVEEFQEWGPTIIGPKGHLIADPKRKGQAFKKWVLSFRKLGYKVEWRELRACDFGAPTIRRRLYVIMRRDGVPIRWPAATHGDPGCQEVRDGLLLPYRTAAEIIDWSLPCPSILMDRDGAQQYTLATGIRIKRPLANNTQARIAAGVKRWVLDAAQPFIVTYNHGGDGFRGQSLGEPFKTVTSSRDAHGLVQPLLVTYYGPRSDGTNDRSNSVLEPLRTVTTEPRHSLVYAFMTAHHTNDLTGVPVDVPLRAITSIPKTDPILVQAVLPPLTDDQAHRARMVAAFLRLHGAWDDREFVTVGEHVVVDLGMRMLTPRELARAQGFPDEYVLAAPYGDRVLTASEQRKKIGNSVCPPVATALVAANYRPQKRPNQLPAQGWLFDEAAA